LKPFLLNVTIGLNSYEKQHFPIYLCYSVDSA